MFDGENSMERVTTVIDKDRLDINAYNLRYLCEQTFPKGAKLEIRFYGSRVAPRNAIDYMYNHPLVKGNQSKSVIKQVKKMHKKLSRLESNRAVFEQSLRQQGIEFIDEGLLQLEIEGEGNSVHIFLNEKCTDVRFALDLFTEPAHHEVYIVTSDTDCLPAIKRAQAEVGCVSFYDLNHPRTNSTLIHATKSFIQFDRQTVIEAYKRRSPKIDINKHSELD